MKALILVDLQNDFLPGGALAVPRGDEVIPLANRVQPAFELVVATQDWHPADHGSFAAVHANRRPGDMIELGGLPQVLWPTHCVQGTLGAEFSPGLDRSRIARVVPKGTDRDLDSYSGFFDNGHKQATGLGDYLKTRGVTDVYVVGLATDYCVKATALDAKQLGFAVHLIVDACRGVELKAGDSDRAIEEMRAAGVQITTSDGVLEQSRGGSHRPLAHKYRKKQVVIDATIWEGPGDHPAVTHPVPAHVPIIENGHELTLAPHERAALLIGAIKTLEGWMLVRAGDYIIRGVQGEHYACKPDIFHQTYERFEADTPAA